MQYTKEITNKLQKEAAKNVHKCKWSVTGGSGFEGRKLNAEINYFFQVLEKVLQLHQHLKKKKN